jgi:uncharacterized phage-associated protein
MTRIDLSLDGKEFFDSPHDYGSMTVQGGEDGVVFTPTGTYRTAFVECFPEGSFIRGEGATIAEADDACWAKLRAQTGCEHQWEPHGYRNGCGTCKHCGGFNHMAFTAEELGLGCAVCGTPTFHTLIGDETNEELRCEPHDPKYAYHVGWLAAGNGRRSDDERKAMRKRLSRVAYNGAPEDPEALAWAYANLDMSRAPRKEDSMTTISVHDIAAFLLTRAGSHLAVSAIHRMAYYAQGWHLAWAGTPLFGEEIRIRKSGPVVHALFAHSQGFTETAWPAGNAAAITGDTAKVLEAVFNAYGHMTGISMGESAHKEAPCILAMSRQSDEDREPVIDLTEMKAFFKALNDAPEDPTAYANRFMDKYTDDALRASP